MSSIVKLWARLDRWLDSNAPEIAKGLNDAASDVSLAGLSERLEIELPQPVTDFYKTHNGQDPDSPWLFDATEFLSVERILEEYEVWRGLFDGGEFITCRTDHPPEMCSMWFSPKWMPISYNGAGDHACLDFSPGKTGVVGQVIEMWHDDDHRAVLGESLENWFGAFVDLVEQGEFEISDEYGGLSRIGD